MNHGTSQYGTLLRIFIGEADKYAHMPLYEWIVLQAREQGLAGATVLRGMMGFGANTRKIHTFRFDTLSRLADHYRDRGYAGEAG